jgi:protein TonB
MKGRALPVITVCVSVCLHGGFLLLFPADIAGPPAQSRRGEEVFSLVNIAVIEPPAPEAAAPPPAVPAARPVPAQTLAENYTDEPEAAPEPAEAEPAAVEPALNEAGGAESVVIAGDSPARAAGDAALTAVYARRNYGYIQRRIRDRLVYPAAARKAGVQGVTEVTFTIHGDGRVSAASVKKSSGYAILDEAAIEAVLNAAPFPSPPAQARISIPVAFRLR